MRTIYVSKNAGIDSILVESFQKAETKIVAKAEIMTTTSSDSKPPPKKKTKPSLPPSPTKKAPSKEDETMKMEMTTDDKKQSVEEKKVEEEKVVDGATMLEKVAAPSPETKAAPEEHGLTTTNDSKPVEEEKKEEETKEATAEDEDDNITMLEEVMVEFLFTNYKTAAFDEGDISGVMHVPMLQDVQTGKFSLKTGNACCDIPVIFHKVDKLESSPTANINGLGGFLEKQHVEDIHIKGVIKRKENSIDNFQLDYQLGWKMINGKMSYRLVPTCDIPNYGRDGPYGWYHLGVRFQSNPKKQDKDIRLAQWEENVGGMLCFYSSVYADYEDFNPEAEKADSEYDQVIAESAERSKLDATYKLKLYTVLSAHRPGVKEIHGLVPGSDPNWTKLEHLVTTRFRSSSSWSKRAVKQYRLFLELKKLHNDYDCKLFAPSGPIEKIWIAHLSFPQQYQQDIRAFCNGSLIEHKPMLGETEIEGYRAAYHVHKARLETYGQSIDPEFWPNPKTIKQRASRQQQHDGDSDDELEYVEPRDPKTRHLSTSSSRKK